MFNSTSSYLSQSQPSQRWQPPLASSRPPLHEPGSPGQPGARSLPVDSIVSVPDSQSESILIASKMVDDAITEVRSISHRLIPEALQFGIGPALNELKHKVEMSNSTRVNLNIEESNSIEYFDKEIQINVYRIVQEVIGNMIKHANASEVTISLSHKDSGHLLLLSDNGVGMNEDQIDKSNGIFDCRH